MRNGFRRRAKRDCSDEAVRWEAAVKLNGGLKGCSSGDRARGRHTRAMRSVAPYDPADPTFFPLFSEREKLPTKKKLAQSAKNKAMDSKDEIILYWSKKDSAFIAEVPELAGCAADGTTYQEALAQVEVVINEWIETAKELGRPIPSPRGRLMFA